MSSDIAIKVENLGKRYEIYSTPRDRLKQFILPRVRRTLGLVHKDYFQEFWALQGVSFDVKKGETIGIVGRNGSGKSTLLQMVSGVLTPTVGGVSTQGRVVALLELGAGFNPEFTGRENVHMNASILGLSQREIGDRMKQIEAFADIGDFIDRPVKNYSSGMYVRLAFAVLAHVDADILIIDEALAVGDAFFTQKCMRFLRSFMKTGTVLFVSHDTSAVVSLCNRAILLEGGRIRSCGTPQDISRIYLADLYKEIQGEDRIENAQAVVVKNNEVNNGVSRDMRLDFINATKFRNDIELVKLDPNGPCFGRRGGEIISVRMLDEAKNPLSWIVGGERVILEITCIAKIDIPQPIIGFYVNDRLGQKLFGENTYNFTKTSPPYVSAGSRVTAEFSFVMPVLPMGEYVISAAFAQGTQVEHVQHHWVHEALLLTSHSSSASAGLVGVPMNNIALYTS